MSADRPERGARVTARPSPFTGGRLGLRSVLILVVVSALAIGSLAAAAASYAAFGRVLLTTIDARLVEIANDIANHIDGGLRAGVPLAQQRRLLAIIDDEQSRISDLDALRVLDDRRVIVFSANRAEIGERLAAPDAPMVAPTADRDALNGARRAVAGGAIVLERPLVGLFNEAIGRVVVTLPAALLADQRQRYATSLLLAVVAIVVGGAALAGLALALLPLSAERDLAALRERLEALFVTVAGGAAVPPSPRVPALAQPLEAFERSVHERLRDLEERERVLRRLDEGS